MIVIESLLFFFKIVPKSALRRHLRTRQKICVSPQILFEDIANFILDTLGIMKITMEFWYGGGARGPMLAPILIVSLRFLAFNACFKGY